MFKSLSEIIASDPKYKNLICDVCKTEIDTDYTIGNIHGQTTCESCETKRENLTN